MLGRVGTVVALVGLWSAVTACVPAVDPNPPSPDPPSPEPAAVGLRQDGLAGLTLSRDVADVSTSDLEEELPPVDGDYVLMPVTESCGVAERRDGSLTAITDKDLAVRAFVVGREGWPTPEGIDIGSSAQDVQEAYADSLRTDLSDEQLLVIDDLEQPAAEPDQSSLLYVFEIDASGRVSVMRAGGFPWLLGCEMTEDYLRSMP